MLIWDSPETINRFIGQHGGGYQTPGSFSALGWTNSANKLIAGVTFFGCNGRNCQMSVAAPYGQIPFRFVLAIGYYIVDQLKLHRLTFFIEESNLPSQALVRHLGATLEATLQDAGKTGDVLIFKLFPEDCLFWSRCVQKHSQSRFLGA